MEIKKFKNKGSSE